MSSSFTDSARSSLAFGDASCRAEVTPSGALAATTSLISMPASSNTNSNANNDVVEIIGRMAGSDPLLNRSPLSSGQSRHTSCSSCSSQEQNAEMQVEPPSPLNISLPSTTSPIAGDLPAKYAVPTATSPSTGFQIPANENGRHSSAPLSPNIPTTAAQFLHNSKIEMLPVTRASISPTATLSPTAIPVSSPLFQQNMILDPLSLPSGVLLPSTLDAVARSHESRQEDEEDDEPQVCMWDNCGKEFPSLSSLVSHLDRGHTLSMTKYICFWKDCPRNLKPFDARYKLITHLRCHTGEKPYSCGRMDCRRSFSRLENLKLHVRTHTGEKPYVCHYDGCDKRFNNTSDRAKHMKTHITRKPYACKFPGCGKSYTDPSSMRKHVKYTHKLREKQMLEEEGASVISIHRSPRKSSSTSRSSTSSTPQSSPGIVIYPTPSSPISALINVTSPVGTTFPSNARILQTVQSPPTPSSTNTINHQSNNLTAAGMTAALTNPTPAPLVSMPFFQLPGQNTAPLPSVPQGVQGIRPLLGTQQQPIVMFLPAANSVSPQKVVTAQQGIPTQPLAVTSNGLTLPPDLQLQEQETGKEKESGEPTDPTAVEKHLRMQIALLQQQLANSQQQKNDESNLRGASPSKISTVTPAIVQQPPVVRILQPAPNSLSPMSQSLTQTQLPTMQNPLPANHAIPAQLPQYIPISNLATTDQLRTLNIAATTTTMSNSKPLTVLNSAPILGLAATGGQTLLPQFVVPGTQVIPLIQSPGVTPQIMYIAPNPQMQPLNGKT